MSSVNNPRAVVAPPPSHRSRSTRARRGARRAARTRASLSPDRPARASASTTRQHGRRESGLDAARLARREQLRHLPALAQHLDPLALPLVLLGGADRLDPARAPELDILAELRLHSLEDLDAPGREMRLEIGRVAPPVGVDAAHVLPV